MISKGIRLSGSFFTSSPRETKLFSYSASCHFGTKNVSPTETNKLCSGGASFSLLHRRCTSCSKTSPPAEEKLPTSHPLARKLTYVPEAHKFSLSASVVVSLARLRLRLGRFRLCVFEFCFFFRIEKILALQFFAAHFFFGFHHFAHHA